MLASGKQTSSNQALSHTNWIVLQLTSVLRVLHSITVWYLLPVVLLQYGCALSGDRSAVEPPQEQVATPIGDPVQIEIPLGLPPVPLPADNPPTAETIRLGRRLFYDPVLSVDNTVACATCHDPDFGFTDGKPVSEGIQSRQGEYNSPTLFNAAYYSDFFWDGRAASLEAQTEGPVQSPTEMGHTLEGVASQLMADPTYRAEFEKAFGPGDITYTMVEKAIASFERTIISGNSPFDRYFYGGDEAAISQAAKRGFEIYRDPKKGNCATCHPTGLFTDLKFHNTGIAADQEGNLVDLGRNEISEEEKDKGAFKTPSLRNVALTAPYMHEGSLKTLKEVIDYYVKGGRVNPHLDPQIKPLTPTTASGEVRWLPSDLEAFLEALTGEIPANLGPYEPQQGTSDP